jgi:hypothetical protein
MARKVWILGQAELSPDGKLLLLCAGSLAYFCDPSPDQPPEAAFEAGAELTGAAFSQNGQIVLTWGQREVQVWDVATRRPIGQPIYLAVDLQQAILSANGQTVVTISGGQARLWRDAGVPIDAAAAITFWAQVLTGKELDADGKVQALAEPVRQERRQRFEDLIGLAAP